MKLKKLTPKSQIRLLKSIRHRLTEAQKDSCYAFLCNHFYFADRALCKIDRDSSGLLFGDGYRQRQKHFTERVPMFTFDNALGFGASCTWEQLGGGWWNSNDYDNRLAFLNWMIDELEKTQDKFIMGAF